MKKYLSSSLILVASPFQVITPFLQNLHYSPHRAAPTTLSAILNLSPVINSQSSYLRGDDGP